MREIKFRGKILKSFNENFHQEKFIYGNLIMGGGHEQPRIINDDFEAPIDEETIGQFIGAKDENGQEIYEHDIVRHDCGRLEPVYYDDSIASFQTGASSNVYDQELGACYGSMRVVGNIFDDSDLLEAR